MSGNLLIVGASTRAAACSALRAELRPWCADLFADVDLQARCPVVRVAAGDYPAELLALLERDVPGPWMYTGGLENHPKLVHLMARVRPLWGNDLESLLLCRSPVTVERLLSRAGLACPRTAATPGAAKKHGRCLVKPLAGAGGLGIAFLGDGDDSPRQRGAVYYQEFIEGTPCAAVYVAAGDRVECLGVTEQLVGATWLHSNGFQYCGSIGPLDLPLSCQRVFERLGQALARGCKLTGLFGVDCVLRDGVPWPVEINPRYTASVEVLEHALGLRALAHHRRAFDPAAPFTPPQPTASGAVVGKAILYAPAALTFPMDGPWLADVRSDFAPFTLPGYADIPRPGEPIEAGHPILTYFVRTDSRADCARALRDLAADLDRRLFGF